MPTLQERLTATHAKAADLYLRRQQIEQQRQRVNADASQCDLALLRTDGEVELLNAMIAEEAKSTDGK